MRVRCKDWPEVCESRRGLMAGERGRVGVKVRVELV